MIKNCRLLTTFKQSRMSKTICLNCPTHPSTGFWTIIVWLDLGFEGICFWITEGGGQVLGVFRPGFNLGCWVTHYIAN